MEQELKVKETIGHTKYRFMRRYLMKFHPETADELLPFVEAKSQKQIIESEKEIINWQHGKEKWWTRNS